MGPRHRSLPSPTQGNRVIERLVAPVATLQRKRFLSPPTRRLRTRLLFIMDSGEEILDAIKEDNNFNYDDDVEMFDVEEGELVDQSSLNVLGKSGNGDVTSTYRKPQSKNHRCKANKKKNKRKRGGSVDIDRFVSHACQRLKERKSYLVYAAVGCFGVSALSELIREVDAIQACGGQMTDDGKRLRTGGGILWNIIKVRDPKAYKEIMSKGKEFEKQFKRPLSRQRTEQKKDDCSQETTLASTNGPQDKASGVAEFACQIKNESEKLDAKEKRASIHDRLRVPVSYDDELLGVAAQESTA